MALNFRQVVKWLVPAWLNDGEGAAVLWVLCAMKDAFTERTRQGLDARFPSRTVASANALTGADRGIGKGRTETNAHYAQRLIRWRWPRGHRTRGNPFALLEQASEYFGGVVCWTIDVRGNRYDRSAAGVETFSQGHAWNWDGAAVSPRWARGWLVLDLSTLASAQPDFGDADLWGGELGDPNYSVGMAGVSAEDALAIRDLVRADAKRPWKPAGVRAEWAIVSLDGTEPTPDGTWLNWSQVVAGVRSATRDPAFRYFSLSPTKNNVYAGDPDVFGTTFPLVDGTPYSGDPDVFPTTITLSDGSSYAGNPDNFPTTIRLLDDGDVPA